MWPVTGEMLSYLSSSLVLKSFFSIFLIQMLGIFCVQEKMVLVTTPLLAAEADSLGLLIVSTQKSLLNVH